MSIKKTLGGDRLGSGKKMQVELHGYDRTTFNLSYLWRSTMSAGTLVPFMNEIALPGDTFDIDLDVDVKTHPTIGPLFGSYKVQLDTFLIPIRLYNSWLHNNKLNIGRAMQNVLLPQMEYTVPTTDLQALEEAGNIDTFQVNPSSLIAYLGIRGFGINVGELPATRSFNAVSFLAYWEIVKNYYANKQEELGAVIHTELEDLVDTVTQIEITHPIAPDVVLPELPAPGVNIPLQNGSQAEITYVGTAPILSQIFILTNQGTIAMSNLFTLVSDTGTLMTLNYNHSSYGSMIATNWRYRTAQDGFNGQPNMVLFNLENIDNAREALLATAGDNQFTVNGLDYPPYNLIVGTQENVYNVLNTQEGLACKTYQSDMFNNWLSSEWIDGVNGINAITAIDTSGGSFTLDTLNLSKKVFAYLNRIAVSGGSFKDWLDATWARNDQWIPESPVYTGGMSKELMFQEVVSNAEAAGEGGNQPLGTLAGKGVMSQRQKGGKVRIKASEPSIIMGIISITPRIDYSQGNRWDVYLRTMNDFHKPALDQIGFQELLTHKMAAWSDWTQDGGVTWETPSAGKQTSWIDYQTNYSRTYGNFAIASNEMFMTLNRRYEAFFNDGGEPPEIADLTTYIDPAKFNFIFANTALDAQNFWSQIGVDIEARRAMSGKIMPNV